MTAQGSSKRSQAGYASTGMYGNQGAALNQNTEENAGSAKISLGTIDDRYIRLKKVYTI